MTKVERAIMQSEESLTWRKGVDKKLNALTRGHEELKKGQDDLRKHIDTHATMIQTNTTVTAANTEVALRVEKRLQELVSATAPAVAITHKAEQAGAVFGAAGKATMWVLSRMVTVGVGVLSLGTTIYLADLVIKGVPVVNAFNTVVAYFNGTVPTSVPSEGTTSGQPSGKMKPPSRQ